MLETVRIPSAVPISPDTAALKAVLVRVRMLVAISARKPAVSSRRFVQVSMVFTLGVLVISDCRGIAECLSGAPGGQSCLGMAGIMPAGIDVRRLPLWRSSCING